MCLVLVRLVFVLLSLCGYCESTKWNRQSGNRAIDMTAVSSSDLNSTNCQKVPLFMLKRIQVPAYDSSYMRVDSPYDAEPSETEYYGGTKVRRKVAQKPEVFEMQDSNFQVLSDEPAWNVDFSSIQESKQRRRRDLRPIEPDATDPKFSGANDENSRKQLGAPWECETHQRWIELSSDYYPRYLRSIQCRKSRCWYGDYQCGAKKYSVHILQRHSVACVDATNLKRGGFGSERAEMWRWVKVDINFFCECSHPGNSRFPF